MKKLFPIAIAAMFLAGCCATSYTYQAQTGGPQLKVSNNRFLWTSDAYSVTFGTNGTASIIVSKSGADNAALGAIVQGVVQGLASAAPKP